MSRFSRPFQLAVYTLSALFGFLTLFFPVPSLSGVLGISFVIVYGVMGLVGGVGGLVGTILPNFKVELPALWLMAGAWLIYDISLWGLGFDRVANPEGNPIPYGPAIAALVVSLYMTWRIIWLSHETNGLIQNNINHAGT